MRQGRSSARNALFLFPSSGWVVRGRGESAFPGQLEGFQVERRSPLSTGYPHFQPHLSFLTPRGWLTSSGGSVLLLSSRACSLPGARCPWLHDVSLDWAAGGLCHVPSFPSLPANLLSSHLSAQRQLQRLKSSQEEGASRSMTGYLIGRAVLLSSRLCGLSRGWTGCNPATAQPPARCPAPSKCALPPTGAVTACGGKGDFASLRLIT